MTMTMTKTMLMSVARSRNPCGRASGRGGKARRGGLGAGRQAGCGRLPEAQPAARRGGGSSVEEEELLRTAGRDAGDEQARGTARHGTARRAGGCEAGGTAEAPAPARRGARGRGGREGGRAGDVLLSPLRGPGRRVPRAAPPGT